MKLLKKKNKEPKTLTEDELRAQYVKDTLERIGLVYSESVKTINIWNKSASWHNKSQSIPITALRQITLDLKMKLDAKALKISPSLAEQQKRTNGLIELIYIRARDECKKMGKKSFPLTMLKDYKDAIIRGFKEGVEEQLNK